MNKEINQVISEPISDYLNGLKNDTWWFTLTVKREGSYQGK